jgi:hypothetical protein
LAVIDSGKPTSKERLSYPPEVGIPPFSFLFTSQEKIICEIPKAAKKSGSFLRVLRCFATYVVTGDSMTPQVVLSPGGAHFEI